MNISLKITSLVFLSFIILLILLLVRKGKISVKYSLVWLFPSLILLLFILIPNFLKIVTRLLGFEVPSNMIFAALIGIIMIITIALTLIVSKQKKQIRDLIQEVSILRQKK